MAKILIGSELGSYSFDKVAKTITFGGFTATLERLLMVTDATNNTIIYQFNDPLLGGTLANNVLTLTYNTNTGSFNNSDRLQIFYWSEEPQYTALMDMAMSIKRDTQGIAARRDPNVVPGGLLLNPSNTLTSVGTVTTVTTVSAVSNLNAFGSSADLYATFPYQLQTRDAFNTFKNKIIS